jgi:hypothetical protein
MEAERASSVNVDVVLPPPLHRRAFFAFRESEERSRDSEKWW